MKTRILDALHGVRHDHRLQEALFCAACWVGFASVVIGAVALPA